MWRSDSVLPGGVTWARSSDPQAAGQICCVRQHVGGMGGTIKGDEYTATVTGSRLLVRRVPTTLESAPLVVHDPPPFRIGP